MRRLDRKQVENCTDDDPNFSWRWLTKHQWVDKSVATELREPSNFRTLLTFFVSKMLRCKIIKNLERSHFTRASVSDLRISTLLNFSLSRSSTWQNTEKFNARMRVFLLFSRSEQKLTSFLNVKKVVRAKLVKIWCGLRTDFAQNGFEFMQVFSPLWRSYSPHDHAFCT